MAVELVFKDKDDNEMQLYASDKNELYIRIGRGKDLKWISLSKSDAIKFSKEVKKQINFIHNENS